MSTNLPSSKGQPCLPTAKLRSAWATSLCLASLFFYATVTAQGAGTVVAWGANNNFQSSVPSTLTNVIAVAAGLTHSLALDRSGAVVGWGDNTYQETNIPSALRNPVAIAGGNGFSLALQSNTVVVGWGTNVIAPTGLTNVVAMAAASGNAMALTSDGNIVAWGVVSLPASPATNVMAIATGFNHSLALGGDGTVFAWGDDFKGQTDLPASLSNVVELAGGQYHSLALRDNGTVVTWGDNAAGQCNVPADLSNVVAIAAGQYHSLALKQNGTVVAWGNNLFLQTNVPAGLSNVVGISAGRSHSLAVVGDGSPVITVPPVSRYHPGTGEASFCVMVAGQEPLSYQWQQDGTNLVGATNSLLTFTNLSTAEAGVFSVTVSNNLGSVTSANVELPPAWRRPFFTVQPLDQAVLCDGTATFLASADGTKPISYQWQYAGTNITSATNSTLTVTGVTGDVTGEYKVVVTNRNGSVTSRTAVLAVIGQPPLIDSPLTATGKQGKTFSYTITGQHNPNLFMADGLPTGLSVNMTNGAIKGTPTVSGVFNVTLHTINHCDSAQTNLTLTLSSSVPVITSSLTVTGTELAAFSYRITATDTPTGFSAGNLPQGLQFDPTTGIISGIPFYAANYVIPISASNFWGVATASLHLNVGYTPVSGLAIANLFTNYSSPYLLDFRFSLRDNNDPTLGNAVVTDPRLLVVTAFEDGQPVSPTETSVLIQSGSAKVLKACLALDFSESIASLDNGDSNHNGISDAVDTEVIAAQDFVIQQPANAQIGVYEFHRDDMGPQQVLPLTKDKTLLTNAIGGIWDNYVQNFPAGSRCWDALTAAINTLGATNSDEEHYVIFCSDGYDTSSTNTVDAVINKAIKANVQIFCVGFGSDIDSATLQSITSKTQGRYYEATNLTALAANFILIGKDLSGQYILRWATLQRSAKAFMPSFRIAYQSFTAQSPANPPPFVSGTNYIIDTNAVPPTTNEVPIYKTNYIISPYLATNFAGDVKVGSLRLASDEEVLPSDISLRATYVPRYIRQMRLHYRANWPCTISLVSTNSGQILAGWSLTQTNDGAGGQWATLTSSNTQILASSIPFAAFGPLLSFSFQDVLNASNAFSFFSIDNTLYTNTGNQSFIIENTNAFITPYPVLPHGTPVPWLIGYGFTNTNNWVINETNDVNGNGLLTWQDYIAGLNPTNASAVFTVRNFNAIGSPSHYRITFSTALNRTYRVETSNNLLTWQTLQDGIAGTGGDITVTDNRSLPASTQQYYRVAVY